MKKNRLNLIFIIIIAATLLAALTHVLIAYIGIANDMSTSFPPYTAFFLFIPYAFAILVEVMVWLIIKIIKNKKKVQS